MTIIGTVQLRDFDRGVVRLLGPDEVTYSVDGAARKAFAVAVPGVDTEIAIYGGRVPVQFVNPEDVYQPAIVPCYRVARTSVSPAFNRQPWYTQAAIAAAPGAREVILPSGDRGYSGYEEQWRATPFDVQYDLTVLGRRQEDALRMLLHALRCCKPPSWPVAVVDSIGDTRQYDAVDLGVDDVSAVADVADRVVGWTMSFTVWAEFDLDDTVTGTAFTGASSLDPHDPLYSRHDLILRTHVGVDPTDW
jgi:hypothetical protein